MTRKAPIRRRRGFTLIEILIVVVILGILAALTVPHFGQAAEDASETAAHSQLNVLRGQVTMYWTKHGSTSAMGDSVDQLIQTLIDQRMLTGPVVDEDPRTDGFQVSGGYTLTWDQSTRAVEALRPDGSATGW